MPKGYFKRIDPTPYRVRLELTGPVTTVHQNEIIHADVATFKDVVGFVFVGWQPPAPPKPEGLSLDPLNPSDVPGFHNIVAVGGSRQAPHKVFLENLKKEQEKPKPTEIKFVEETEEATPAPVKTPENKENDNKALIEYLSKFDNKKWFVMKKEDARDYLDRLGVDRSNLPNSKNEFIKLLKDYIKSLGD
jgi:hypothetical protein